MKKLSIIIPALNEEKRILPTLKSYYSFFNEKLKDNFELIIVPNNCSDNTFEVVKSFSKGKSQFQILNIPYYSGKGGAVLKGFEIAEGNFIGFVDADLSIKPDEFYKLFLNIKDSDGIIGSRWMKKSKVFPKRSFDKRLNSFIFNILVYFLFNLNYKDTQCGAKIFSKKVAKYFIKNIKEKGWIFDVELLYLSKKNNFKIKEFPIYWSDCDGSVLTFYQKIKSFFQLFILRFSL